MAENVSLALLLAGSLAGSYLALKAKARAALHTNAVYVIALSLLTLSLAALGRLTLDPTGSDTGTLLRMLENLAIYAGLPMCITALLCVGYDLEISLPGWGRWLLGLFALFELLRRMGHGELYLQILTFCLLAGMLLAAFKVKSKQLRALLGVSWICAVGVAGLHFSNELAFLPAVASLPAFLMGYASILIAKKPDTQD